MRKQVVHVFLRWFLIVLCAETNKGFLRDKAKWRLPFVVSYVCHEDVNSKIKLFTAKEERAINILLYHIVIHSELGNIFEPLSQDNSTPLRSLTWFTYESLCLALIYVLLSLTFFFR